MSKSRSRSPLCKKEDSLSLQKSVSKRSSGCRTTKSASSHQNTIYNNSEKVDTYKQSGTPRNGRSSSNASESYPSIDGRSKSSDFCSSTNLENFRPTQNSTVTSIPGNGTNQVNNTIATGFDNGAYKPTTTILIRGLSKDVTESDIYKDIVSCNFMPMDIRLIRRKLTGTPRGFAFVEFDTIEEAKQYMDMKKYHLVNLFEVDHQLQLVSYPNPYTLPPPNLKHLIQWFDSFLIKGSIRFENKCQAFMQYGLDSKTKEISVGNEDWFCIKCSTRNFRKRTSCYTCQTSKSESLFGGACNEEACSYPTEILMFRNLDALTTEESVLTFLNSTIPELVKSVIAVRICRDPVTSLSLGVCYLSTGSTMDSLAITYALSKAPLVIDNKPVVLSYCKYAIDMANKFPKPVMRAESSADVFADTAAKYYAKNLLEYVQYLEYYKNYYQGLTDGTPVTIVGYSTENVTNWNRVPSCASTTQVDTNSENTASSSNVDQINKNKPIQMDLNPQTDEPSVDTPDFEQVVESPRETDREKNTQTEVSPQKSIVATMRKRGKLSCFKYRRENWLDKQNWKERNAPAKQMSFTTYDESSSSSNNGDETFEQEWLDLKRKVCNLCKRRFKTCAILFEHAKHSELHKCNLKVRKVSKSFDEHMTRLLQG